MQQKSKVMFVTASTSGGGAERMLFNIINGINNKKCLVITSSDKVPSNQNPDYDVTILGKEHAINAFKGIIKCINEFSPNYIFTTSSNVGYLLILAHAFTFVKYKVYIRCAVTPCEIYGNGMKNTILKYVNRFTYRWSDLVIAQTNFMKADIEKAYSVPADKVKTIRNIIDGNFLKSQSIQYNVSDFDSSYYNIVALGALYSIKGFDLLIDAVAPLIQSGLKIRLYIIGNERYENGYKLFLQDKIDNYGLHNSIALLGAKANPYPYVKTANLLVMSSRKEGFPNVVLEALYLQTPVVATNCVDFSGVIVEGVHGYVVNKGEVESLRVGIQKAMNTEFDLTKYRLENFNYNTLFL